MIQILEDLGNGFILVAMTFYFACDELVLCLR